MGCFIGCLAAFFPRVALALVWLFGGNYLERAYDQWYWPVLGFLFLPLTTLAFAYGMLSLGKPNEMEPLGWLLVAIGLLMDLGVAGGGSAQAKKRWQEE